MLCGGAVKIIMGGQEGDYQITVQWRQNLEISSKAENVGQLCQFHSIFGGSLH